MKRRTFLHHGGHLALGMAALGLGACGQGQPKQSATEEEATADLFFSISLAQWSLHRTLFAGDLDNLGFAAAARNDYGVDAVEYVNAFFKDKAKDTAYLTEMIKRADDHGVRSLLIMVDGEGGLGVLDDAERTQAVENHYKWVDAAKLLGCHSIRVNAFGQGTAEEVAAAAVDGLGRLAEYASTAGINVLVENHGGYSSNGQWLAGVMAQINRPNCGTLPDFGNFCIRRSDGSEWGGKCEEEYDRYQGVAELMPYAKAVSAKSNDFGPDGQDTGTDYARMLGIVKEAGYTGYIGIEYEGQILSEQEGIRATKKLLEISGRSLMG